VSESQVAKAPESSPEAAAAVQSLKSEVRRLTTLLKQQEDSATRASDPAVQECSEVQALERELEVLRAQVRSMAAHGASSSPPFHARLAGDADSFLMTSLSATSSSNSPPSALNRLEQASQSERWLPQMSIINLNSEMHRDMCPRQLLWSDLNEDDGPDRASDASESEGGDDNGSDNEESTVLSAARRERLLLTELSKLKQENEALEKKLNDTNESLARKAHDTNTTTASITSTNGAPSFFGPTPESIMACVDKWASQPKALRAKVCPVHFDRTLALTRAVLGHKSAARGCVPRRRAPAGGAGHAHEPHPPRTAAEASPAIFLTSPVRFQGTSTLLRELLSSTDADSRSALHIAAMNGNIHFCLTLIKNGIDISAPDSVGNTPLHLARDAETTRILLKVKIAGSIEPASCPTLGPC
jgi:hypothetical protein